jgi:hypothetical protein
MASDRAADIGGLRRALALGLLITALAAAQVGAAGKQTRGEYEVKAAIVYNMLKFVEWPENGIGSPELRICVAGDLHDAAPFLELHDQQAAGRRVIVVRSGSAPVRECQVLFLAIRDEQQLQAMLLLIKGAPVLTITEHPGLRRNGSVVNFVIVDRKVVFDINAGAARRAGLKISSKLLKLARTVFDREEAGE